MNYQHSLFDLESFINGQRPPIAIPDYSASARSLPYPANLPKDPQTLQNPLAFYQNQLFRQSSNDDSLLGMFESVYTNRREEDRRFPIQNNNSNLSDFVKQKKVPNNMQHLAYNPQIPPLKSQRSQQAETARNRNIRPQSLNTPGKVVPPNMEIINLETDESLAQLLNPSRPNLDLMMNPNNNRGLSYQNDDAINHALLLNSLGYGKPNPISMLPQLPDDSIYGLNDLNLGGVNPLLLQAMGMDDIYNQMKRDYLLSGLGTDQQLLPLLGQTALPNHLMATRKPNPIIHAEPILIDDSPESEMFVPPIYNNYDKERRAVKEEFMGKPTQSYQPFIKTEIPNYQLERQSLNNKRMLVEPDPQMQIYSSPIKKIETNAKKEIQVSRRLQPETKPVKPEIKTPVKSEKQLPGLIEGKFTPEKPSPIRQMPIEMFSQALTISQETPKKPTIDVQTPTKNVQPTQFAVKPKSKESTPVKKGPIIQIDKISLPETGIAQQEIPESQVKVKQSPTMLTLHKNHGQIQVNTEQNNPSSLQVKLVSTPVKKVEKKAEIPTTLFNDMAHEQPILVNPLNVNQNPEKLTTEVKGTTVQLFPVKEEKTLGSDDKSIRRKRKDSADIVDQSGKRERKPNKLQMLRVAYQTYLEELKKPYKISIHVDPTNTDEKIVNLKVGEGYQVDVDALLADPTFLNQRRKIVQRWNPECISPKQLDEYYTKFGQIIGQKITNEETALKNLEKFEMDVDKALDNAKRNRLFYQNYFRLDQRQLRTRANYVL